MAEDDEVVQPPEGQGDQSNSSPYAEYLVRLPEEVRGDVEPVFRDWDAQTTRKFQDAAEYRKQWEPLEQEYVDPTVESLVEQRLAAQLGPVANQLQELTEWRQAQEFGRAEAQAM